MVRLFHLTQNGRSGIIYNIEFIRLISCLSSTDMLNFMKIVTVYKLKIKFVNLTPRAPITKNHLFCRLWKSLEASMRTSVDPD